MFGFCNLNLLSAKCEAVHCVAHPVLLSLPCIVSLCHSAPLSLPCIVSLCHSVLLSLPCLTDEEGIVTYYFAIVCAVNFVDVDLWMSDAKMSWRNLKRAHVPIVIIYTKWTWLVFINEATPQISCLLCFNVVGLNCFERKCQYEVTFDILRNTKIISVCLVFHPESISSQQRYSLQPSRYSPSVCIVQTPLFFRYYRLNIKITSGHVYTRSHRVVQKSPYIRIWYLRAPLVRSAVSRSCDWSPWTRWVVSEVSRPHPTWFLLAGAFEVHAVPGETTKFGPSKGTH
jgi:hypothetical protein